MLSFRCATHADVNAVVSLVESAYRGESSRAGWTTEADLLDGQRTDAAEVRSLVDAADSLVWLAEASDTLLGSVWLARRGNHAHIGMFAVRPTHQAGGVGRRLLAHAEAQAVARFDVREVEMTVIAQRAELIAWYERRGYLRTNEVRPFPYGDPRFGAPKRHDLEFVVLKKALGIVDETVSPDLKK